MFFSWKYHLNEKFSNFSQLIIHRREAVSDWTIYKTQLRSATSSVINMIGQYFLNLMHEHNMSDYLFLAYNTAQKTLRSMGGNDSAAVRTFPSLTFFEHKFFNPDLFDSSKIINHAHTILCFIPLVKLPEAYAGKFRTYKTELFLGL
jgi:hypothetical protein